MCNNFSGKRCFHFEGFWPKLVGFQEVVATAWHSVGAQEPPLQRLFTKLSATRRALQSWSQQTVGNVAQQLEQARELLHMLDIAQDTRGLSWEESWLRQRFKPHCLALASLNRTIKRIRSIIDWLQDGDANTQFFHSHARLRKHKNFIASIRKWSWCTQHSRPNKMRYGAFIMVC